MYVFNWSHQFKVWVKIKFSKIIKGMDMAFLYNTNFASNFKYIHVFDLKTCLTRGSDWGSEQSVKPSVIAIFKAVKW